MQNRKKRQLFRVLLIALLAAGGCSQGEAPPAPEEETTDELAGLKQALLFHASFDDGPDAAYAAGDKRIYTAPSYKEQDQAAPGIGSQDIELAPDAGRFGHALKFNKKNTMALFYRAADNVAYSPTGWSGTVSFWLSLDPAQDLEPGYCDPIQITDADYNDACVWVDFTKDNPRQFRLGVFGDLAAWNPNNIEPDKNPDFEKRLVAVNQPPFQRGKWTHVVITHEGLGGGSGSARLYLDGNLQGSQTGIAESFTWDAARGAIRLGVNYAGLFDEVAVFNRAFSDEEVRTLHVLENGVAALHP